MPARVALVLAVVLASAEAWRLQPKAAPRRTALVARSETPRVESRDRSRNGVFEATLGATLLLGMNAVAPEAAMAAEAWVKPASLVLGPAVNIAILMFLMRTVLSWYPNKNLNKLPWNLVAWPTEPVLAATRKIVPPAFGVDISPIVWIFILSFINETLLGPQGLFQIMLSK